ncbi:MAG: lysR [Phenylobacterium sp.]|uniref:LysR substrate-binding domain-containing protein n=1 Tax=Phenylobacterium sp. TaxID=1871053 RepID=UPI00261474A7|nr:LysR substrate-binding domain-containing protein [Phenylobacterium sp.]MDB5499625.1 lysR [Phenylobacterium sp.]
MRRRLDHLLKFRQLRMVEALARHQSLTRAAGTLGLTQPALTKMVRELEKLVGEPLFERHARGVRPTAAGQVVLRYARGALADLGRLEDELDLKGGPAQASVVVGALPVAAVGVLPNAIIRARAEHPGLQIRLVEGQTEALLAQLEAGEVDVVVGRLYPAVVPDTLVREVLYAEPISIMARSAHPLLRIKRPTVRDLAAFDLVLPTFNQRINQDIEQFMAAVGLSVSPGSIRSTSRGFIREVMLATDMITVMPQMVMGGDLLRGQVRVLPIPAPALDRPAGVITNPQRGVSAGGRLLIQALRETVRELS